MSGLSLTVPEKMESSLQYDKQVVHIGAFEGMQGVAALMVFCAHLHSVIFREGLDAEFGSRTMALSKAFGSARSLGVEVFFLLSGFLVYGSLRSKRFCWSDYLKRRFLRLFPVFLFVLSLYILLSIRYPSQQQWQPVVIHFGQCSHVAWIVPRRPYHYRAWSLRFEWCFYLTLPLFVLLPGFRQRVLWHRVLCWIALIVIIGSSGVTARFTMFIAGVKLQSVWNLIDSRSPLLAGFGRRLLNLGADT